jgi:hypothetical protein
VATEQQVIMNANIEKHLNKFQLKRPRSDLRAEILAAAQAAVESPTLTDHIWRSRPVRRAACALFVMTVMFNLIIVSPQQTNLIQLSTNENQSRKETRQEKQLREFIEELNGDGKYLMAQLNLMKTRTTPVKQYIKMRKHANRILNENM